MSPPGGPGLIVLLLVVVWDSEPPEVRHDSSNGLPPAVDYFSLSHIIMVEIMASDTWHLLQSSHGATAGVRCPR